MLWPTAAVIASSGVLAVYAAESDSMSLWFAEKETRFTFSKTGPFSSPFFFSNEYLFFYKTATTQ